MSNPIKQIFILFFSAALLFGCSGEDLPVITDDVAAIQFSARVDNASSNTKSEAVSTGSLKNFGVYASVNSAAPYLLMENEHIYKTQNNNWIYNNIKYWPLNERVSFFAYSPYGDSNISVSYPDKNITCIIPDNPDNQFDLMVAAAADKSAGDGAVGLLFGHLLSRIDFAVSVVDNEKNYNISLNAFELVINENAIYNSGVYDMTSNTWSIDNNSYMSGGNHQLIKTATILPGEGWDYSMMLLPQEHKTGNMTVNISYSIFSGDTEITTKQVSVPLSQIVCEQGKKYTYNFKITPAGMKLEIGVLPWNTDGWGAEVYPDNP